MRSTRTRFRFALGPLLTALIMWFGVTSAAADDHIDGVITERADSSTVFVQTGTARVLVTFSEDIDVRQTSGFLRRKTVSAEELIPGLRVSLDGQFETPDKFVAKRVTFSKEALKIASAIQAGITPTDLRSLANQSAIQKHGQELEAQRGDIAANGQRISVTSGAVTSTNARISNLANFSSVKTLTVHFANGRYDVTADETAQLQELASQAQGLQGYMISVAAYASAVGPAPLNQRLSRQRADAVTAILQQAGVPPANVMVPAAMGVSQQVAPNTTAQGQAENRRAVVTLLQNKGIAGN
jgi:outer membrane protein OmpA-like peptidoglycan-associated protein